MTEDHELSTRFHAADVLWAQMHANGNLSLGLVTRLEAPMLRCR